ncbi:aminodeoxychorismate/anthranilate synthase component II [Leptospira langatensis]|uniref:Aminodeoxychorismate/anthranilate synthase component II n=1 Tax=Leptospira langatensis TaxID=2484983 RepID=A0A5F1ZUJ3_9LEPT|nr:aminodeoxychorismate/anthranilate synthase component II [Leptospira langatensis]TGJ98818.1 aminodeoxychorismate/anthranilate synthase component II [Leptospira langatensis]TGL40615.1 aminodeoxychorismate/anthranilate synthase component II [Leptospira langatensis]
MKVLLVDHHDSFSYNLFQLAGEILEEEFPFRFQLDVIRQNEADFSRIVNTKYDRILLSPGPGTPTDPEYFGCSLNILQELGGKVSILGVCLGMQGIAHFAGARIKTAERPMHGKISEIENDGRGVFSDLPKRIRVMRYHSLLVDEESLSQEWERTAYAGNELMGLRNLEKKMEGIQFHPESFATEGGRKMLSNFLIHGLGS